jgi:protocatechuate 3,4-dioxygenase beta subunit
VRSGSSAAWDWPTTVAGCSSDDGTTTGSSGSSSATVGPGRDEIPEETAGPFPGDGSNGVDVLAESGVVRSDITSSFGSSTTVAEGVPLTVRLRVLDVSDGASAGGLAGAAVYLWHCGREGRYSLYSDGVTNENYLRGVQVADGDGYVTFTSIYPAAYSGRWPHIHFEVYPGIEDATSAGNKLRTTQLALPEDVSRAVYATDGYDASIANLGQTSLQTDTVFSDGYSLQVAKVTGSVDGGLTATLNVPVEHLAAHRPTGLQPRRCLTDWRYSHSMASLSRWANRPPLVMPAMSATPRLVPTETTNPLSWKVKASIGRPSSSASRLRATVSPSSRATCARGGSTCPLRGSTTEARSPAT